MGRPILRSEEQAGDIVVKDIMCGDEAAAARSMLQISYPVWLFGRPLLCIFVYRELMAVMHVCLDG